MKNRLIDLVLSFSFARKIYHRWLIKKQHVIATEDFLQKIEKADKVILSHNLPESLMVGIVKDDPCNIKGYTWPRSYYLMFERFLKNNRIDYQHYDIQASDWIERSIPLDIIIGHTYSDPASLQISKNKIYFLEKKMGKVCFPSFEEIWGYEDKINLHYLYTYNQLPQIPSFASFSKEEAMEYVQHKAQYPLISKITTGSSSHGVEKVNNKANAERIVKQAFSRSGRKTYFPFIRQKNYVYFQQYINTAEFDLRVIVSGDMLFGYYRYPRKGDFRASGSGIYQKKEIPVEALELAYHVKKCYKCNCLATDMLFDKQKGQYYLIESSIFIGIDTCEQLKIENISGYYKRISKGNYQFIPGKFWIQELMLFQFFSSLSKSIKQPVLFNHSY